MAVYTQIDNPELYMQVKLYSGTGSELAVTLDGDENMQPDFVWSKNRDQSEGHKIFDSVRGVTKFIMSNNTDADATAAQTLKSFDSDGVTIGTDADMNTSSEKNVLWCWKESADAGFDMVTHTGTGSARTISHSLSAVPEVMIVKARNAAEGWAVYHHKMSSAPETDYIYLHLANAVADYAGFWNDTAPTSSVFSVGDADNTNSASGYNYISYLFSGKQGFSKFGSYTGNGNADGTFVYTGFRPAFIMLKNATDGASGDEWFMEDAARSTYNPTGRKLSAHLPNSETGISSPSSWVDIDFLSNGFKIRTNDAGFNESGDNFIYMCFAEAPFVNSKGVPCNAR